MNSATIIVFYDGHLSIDENLILTFSEGRSRPMRVPADLKLDELKNKIRSSLQIDTRYSITLICNYAYGSGFIATYICDDEVCGVILEDAKTERIAIYVQIEECQSSYSVEETVVIAPENPIEYVPCSIPSIDTTVIPPRSSQHFASFQSEPYAIARAAEDDDYETMDSDSSRSQESSESDEADDFPQDDSDDIIQGHNLIRDHCLRNVAQEQDMIMNNDYVNICQTTREWDADEGVDERPFDHGLLSHDVDIPTDLVEGMCFSSKRNLQFAVMGWSIQNNVRYVPITSNKKNYTLRCAQHDHPSRSCNWRAQCSASKRLGGAWRISRLTGFHTCVNVASSGGHPQCTSKFISYFILPALRRQIDMKPREIVGRMEAKFNISVSYMKAWDARRKAIKALFGSWEESYRSLFLFMESVSSVLPGTTYKIQTTSGNRFQRIFWAFGPSISGWQYCRPVISLDGTFLLGKFRGTLLAGVGYDANNGLFPLAFAVVEAESNDSWQWFLLCLRDCLPVVSSRPDLCFISDKHAGLLRGCREIFPFAAHRHCLRHLRENFKKVVRKMAIGDVEFICQKMYMAGNSDDMTTFNQLMTDIINIKPDAYNWLVERDVTKWSLLNDGGMRYGAMTTNASECFNSVLKRARGLPIQALIIAVYYNIITIFLKRHKSASAQLEANESPFAQRTLRQLQQYEREARNFPSPIDINRSELQVFDRDSRSFQVQISSAEICSCTCGRCEMYHMPCAHAIKALASRRRVYTAYVSRYYSLDFYKNTYTDEFHTLPDRSYWPNYNEEMGLPQLLPPPNRRRSGRPRSNRFRNMMDEGPSRRR